MVFQKSFENAYHELDLNTQYRFAEIELSFAIKTLTVFHKMFPMPRQTSVNLLYKAIAPKVIQIPGFENKFLDAMNSTYVNNPPKPELIQYLIIRGHSYQKIREITQASFNTISKHRYGLPQYYPAFAHWSEEMMSNWNDIKYTLNLFNEETAHTKE
jgi:hypothetical protein